LNNTEIFSLITNIKGYEKSLNHDSLEKSKKNNDKPFQKYEFLGDRVLGLIIAEYLIKKFQKDNLDEISRRFIHLVNTNTLSKIFKKFEINEIFKHQLDPNSNKNSVYADALESLIGFIYTNKGLDFTRNIVLNLWQEELDTLPQKDPKTFIQEYSQRKNKKIPSYKLIKESGTKHKPKFIISLKIDHFSVEGEGVSKQKAEIAAAKKMIKLIFDK
jgi:ribonuclease-3|tara:strand:- start:320 stop:967 length:648 start_codon:yes stop_codon:yes gene_type:complete